MFNCVAKFIVCWMITTVVYYKAHWLELLLTRSFIFLCSVQSSTEGYENPPSEHSIIALIINYLINLKFIVCSIIISTIYYNFFAVPVQLPRNKITQYLYNFAETTATEKGKRISEYIVHCSYFLKVYLCLM